MLVHWLRATVVVEEFYDGRGHAGGGRMALGFKTGEIRRISCLYLAGCHAVFRARHIVGKVCSLESTTRPHWNGARGVSTDPPLVHQSDFFSDPGRRTLRSNSRSVLALRIRKRRRLNYGPRSLAVAVGRTNTDHHSSYHFPLIQSEDEYGYPH